MTVAIVLPLPSPIWRPRTPPASAPAAGPIIPASPCCFTTRTEVTVPQFEHVAAGAGPEPATLCDELLEVAPVDEDGARSATRLRGSGAARVTVRLSRVVVVPEGVDSRNVVVAVDVAGAVEVVAAGAVVSSCLSAPRFIGLGMMPVMTPIAMRHVRSTAAAATRIIGCVLLKLLFMVKPPV